MLSKYCKKRLTGRLGNDTTGSWMPVLVKIKAKSTV